MTQWGIDALFNPGKRHMDEEKRRLQSTRQEIGDSSGGKRIDLKSGKVTLKGKPKPGSSDEDLDSTESESAEAVESDSAAAADESEDGIGANDVESRPTHSTDEPAADAQ